MLSTRLYDYFYLAGGLRRSAPSLPGAFVFILFRRDMCAAWFRVCRWLAPLGSYMKKTTIQFHPRLVLFSLALREGGWYKMRFIIMNGLFEEL